MKKDIEKLVIKISGLIAIVFVTLLGIEIINPFKSYEFEYDYSASVIDKQKYASSLKSPKLIAIGGSNMVYGFNSNMVSDSLRMPVVNLSQQYSLGSYFMLQQAGYNAKSGDIILLSFEYMLSSKGSGYEKSLVSYYYPDAYLWIAPKAIERFSQKTTFYLTHIKNTLGRIFGTPLPKMQVSDTNYINFRKAFNPQGDLISHLNNKQTSPITNAILSNSQSMKEVISDINFFTKEMEKKHVKVYFSFCPFNKSSYLKNKAEVDRIQGEFDKFATFTQINRAKSMVFDDALFYDMAYHLNTQGRDIRTEILINQLKKALQSK